VSVIPLSKWYPSMYEKWEARLAELRRAGVSVDVLPSDRRGLVIHHTVGGWGVNATAYARQVADQHWNQWKRPGGYNFLVGFDGVMREMSGLTHVGVHSGTTEWNVAALGLAFQGDFRTIAPHKGMLDAGRHMIGTTPVKSDQWTHREVRPSPTTCPGNALIALLPLEPSMTKQEILDTLGITNAELGTVKQLREAAVAEGIEVSIVPHMRNLFRWGKTKDFPGAGGGVSEADVKRIVAGSGIVPPD